jgi:hypothetical protein
MYGGQFATPASLLALAVMGLAGPVAAAQPVPPPGPSNDSTPPPAPVPPADEPDLTPPPARSTHAP